MPDLYPACPCRRAHERLEIMALPAMGDIMTKHGIWDLGGICIYILQVILKLCVDER